MILGTSRIAPRPVFRFAPSPNGYLHLGHALSALINGDAARACGGRILLRIEDIDPARCRLEFEAAILEDLEWLGLSWERPVRRQSEHLELYRAHLDELGRQGLVYPCFCSRAKIGRTVAALEKASGKKWSRDPDGAVIYPGTCRELEPRGREADRGRRAPRLAPSRGAGERHSRFSLLARA
jgi:glutamyl-Q tRNA(Asp) synthetase